MYPPQFMPLLPYAHTDYYYPVAVYTWMDQMSSYPPPPGPDQSHYNPNYLTEQDQLNFAQQLGSPAPAYPKLEHEAALDPNTSSQIEQRIEQLTQQHQLQSQPPPQDVHQHQSQHQHQPFPSDPSLQGPPPPQQLGLQGQEQTPNKVNRLRKACDSCSIRKVKCDESGPPCKACAALDIPCTFERPSRRRGPPNRHAEAIKRRRLESPNGVGSGTGSIPSSPTHAAQALAALSSHPANTSLSAESILPVDTVDLLINDYFTYIHPLCPFPHEPSFREAWRRREDYNNRPFLALLASMIGALVASFPRKPRLHLKAQGREHLFPNHLALIERCQKVCAAARGPGYLESENLSVHDAATSYLLGLAGTYTFRWRQGRLYLGECLTILRALGLHKAKDNTYQNLTGGDGLDADGNREDIVDNITLQIGRRVFWTMFVTGRSMVQLNISLGEVWIAPETPTDPYPPLPVEVDDFCIFPTHIDPQPPGLLPMMTGFNSNVRIFLADQPMSIMELAWGNHTYDWEKKVKVLQESLRRCKDSLQELPHQLNLRAFANGSNEQDAQDSNNDLLAALQPALARENSLLSFHDPEASPEERRNMQYEIQKANIYASYLASRCHTVEKYFITAENLAAKQEPPAAEPVSPDVIGTRLESILPRNTEQSSEDIASNMQEERENIIKDLLVVLSSIDKVNMEPNGDSFTHKIRFIASTLIDVPKSRKGSVAQQSEQYLRTFVDILSKLEHAGPTNVDPDQPEDEEAELRHWADLRDYQMKFMQQGGVLGLS